MSAPVIGELAAIPQLEFSVAGAEAAPRAAVPTIAFTLGVQRTAGAPVRIHIEGVGSPMRATLRDDAQKGAVVGSDLKMLRIGAVVELEDKETACP